MPLQYKNLQPLLKEFIWMVFIKSPIVEIGSNILSNGISFFFNFDNGR